MNLADFATSQLTKPEISARLAFIDMMRHTLPENPLARDSGVWKALSEATSDPKQPEAVRAAASLALDGLTKPAVRAAPVMRATRQLT